jgi:hypothetical protein
MDIIKHHLSVQLATRVVPNLPDHEPHNAENNITMS